MGFLDRLSGWFRREAEDVATSLDELEDRLDADLTRRERELAADPSERMEMISEDTTSDDLLASVRDRIEGSTARADAVEDLLDVERPEPDEGESPEP